ncbi:hypothetical protein DJ568_07415 [Mucilaginibacter hurinus]|uniref:Cadherin-like beta-sandwich-like domain-containing protein n=1 Tax=Mucilaginibacter hurinus TaxID=2201324 RepID=A0A367GRJ7_9SPHI|nr:cadherin-like beta sandwich domain-containing protein [Mucilaginibacter hurinus]RCH55705.1 hypothetical protein DJ568_07415 [Mucilaginibacter hurinus]
MNKLLRSSNPLKSISFLIAFLVTGLVTLDGYAQLPTVYYTSRALQAGVPVLIQPISSNVGSLGNYAAPTNMMEGQTIRHVARDGKGNLYYTVVSEQDSRTSSVYKLPAGSNTPEPTPISNVPYFEDMVVDEANGDIYYSLSWAHYNAVYKLTGGTGTAEVIISESSARSLALDGKGNLYTLSYDGTYHIRKHPLNGGAASDIINTSNILERLQSDSEGNIYYVSAGKLNMLPASGSAEQTVLVRANVTQHFFIAPHTDFSDNYFIKDFNSLYLYPVKSQSRRLLHNFGYAELQSFTSIAGVVYFCESGVLKKAVPTGGHFLLNPLPKGLKFNSTYGDITGTPTEAVADKDYKVISYNATGSYESVLRLSVDFDVQDIELTGATLNTAFTKDVYTYDTSVSNATDSISIKVKSTDNNAALTINGMAATQNVAFPVKVNAGSNTVTIIIGPAGLTKTYVINAFKYVNNPSLYYPTPKVYALNANVPTLQPVTAHVQSSGTYVNLSTVTTGTAIPTAQAFDKDGNLYIAGLSNGTIFKIAEGTTTKVTIASGFSSLWGIAVDGKGDIYVSESFVDSRVIKINAKTLERTVIGTDFDGPRGIAVDSVGNVYVADNGNNQLKKIPAGGGDPVVVASGLDQPMGVTLDSDGNIYVSCFVNGIYKLPAVGGSKIWLAYMPGAYGIKADPAGNLYTVSNKIVYMRPAAGGALVPIAKTPDIGTVYDIAVSGTGEVYIADATARAIKKITPTSGYHLSWFLPEGMAFSSVTGAISGKPLSLSAPHDYVITAYNANGSGRAPLSIEVIRAKPGDASLANIVVDQGVLDQPFNADVTEYTVIVGKSTNSINITPTSAQRTSTLTVNDMAFNSGSTYDMPLNMGTNKVTIKSSAQYNVVKTYIVTVIRQANSTATLAGLNISAGTLTPAFDSSTTDYAALIRSNVNTFSVTPTLADTTGVITVNGAAAVSGQPYALTPVAGENVINVVVTAEDGVIVKTYKLVLTRTNSAEASLANITANTEDSINFRPDVYDYSFTVKSTPYLDITVVTADSLATLTIDGSPANSGVETRVSLAAGLNTKKVVVTAENGSTTTYTFNITCDISNNARLSSINTGPNEQDIITPAFDSGVLDYNITVKNRLSTTLYATAENPASKVVIDGKQVISGEYVNVSLVPGANHKEIVVTAEDGTTLTYNVNIDCPKASNAGLAGLTTHPGTFDKPFSYEHDSYDINLGHNDSVVAITVTPIDDAATITFDGHAVTAGEAIQLTVAEGATAKVINILASDGETSRNIQVNINRAVGPQLATLEFHGVVENEFVFDPGTYNYSITTPSNGSSATVYATADPSVTVRINGTPTTGGYYNFVANEGEQMLDIELVTAGGIVERTYKMVITGTPVGNNLTNLTASAGTLVPAFSPAIKSYTLEVPEGLEYVEITPYVSEAYVTINGQQRGSGAPVNVYSGLSNLLLVFAQAVGGGQVNYNINIKQPASTNASLSNITLNSGALNPKFNVDITSYVVKVLDTVKVINVTPFVSKSSATVKINGAPADNDVASADIPVNLGDNNITIEVTAQAGNTKTYNILVQSAVPQVPVFTKQPVDVQYYNSQEFSFTGVADHAASYLWELAYDTGNGPSDFRNAQSYFDYSTINEVDTTIRLRYLFPNGYARLKATNSIGESTYSNVVKFEEITNDHRLLTLVPDQGTLSPAFDPEVTQYTLTLGNDATSVSFTATANDPNVYQVGFNGVSTIVGESTAPIALTEGNNKIVASVFTYGGSPTRVYNVNVIRTANAGTATLANLTISNGTLSPAFVNATPTYSVAVDNAVTGITLTPTVAYDGSTVTVKNITVLSGSASANVPLAVGTNAIPVIVRSANGEVVKTYTVNVNRHTIPAVITRQPVPQSTYTQGSPVIFTVATQNALHGAWQYKSANGTVFFDINDNGNLTGSKKDTINVPYTYARGTFRYAAVNATGLITYSNEVKFTLIDNDTTLLSLTPSKGTLVPAFNQSVKHYTLTVQGNGIGFAPVTADKYATISVNNTQRLPARDNLHRPDVPLEIGENIIPIDIYGYNGTATQRYTVTVTRLPSAEAELKSIALNNNLPNKPIDEATGTYSNIVLQESVTITPEATDNSAVITVNGVSVVSGSPSSAISLLPGENDVPIVITSSDNSVTKHYTAKITRGVPASDAGIASITLSTGEVATLNSETNTFTTSVNFSPSLPYRQITSLTSDQYATIKYNGYSVPYGREHFMHLQLGENTMPIEVTAADGVTRQNYTLVVTAHPIAGSAALKSFVYNTASMSDTINRSEDTFYLTVNPGDSYVTITANAVDSTAVMIMSQGDDTPETSGIPSARRNLQIGLTSLFFYVNSPSGDYRAYNLRITRPRADALTGIGLTAGTLSPEFSAADTAYTVQVPADVYSIAITPKDSTSTTNFKINGVNAEANKRSAFYQLPDGKTVITIIAADGTPAKKAYTVTVNRIAVSNDATLASLSYTGGSLSPAFNASKFTYAGTVDSMMNTIHVVAQPSDAGAEVKVNGIVVTSGIDIPAVAGINKVVIVVTSSSGTVTKTYTLNVLVGDPRATLAGLEFDDFTVLKKNTKGPHYRNYTATVERSFVRVIATTHHSGAVLKVNGDTVISGTLSAPIPLNIGANTINTEITSENGATTNIYSIVVTRKAATDATLSALILDPNIERKKVTGVNYRDYIATVPYTTTSVTALATPTDTMATIDINGGRAVPGIATAPIALNVGRNTINTAVTAADGKTVSIYSIVITRLASSDATLAGLTINPDVAKNKVKGVNYRDYTAKVAADVTSVSITAATSDAGASIKVNNVPLISGMTTAPIQLNVGANTITTAVTAADGKTVNVYNTIVTRLPSSDATLAGLVINPDVEKKKVKGHNYRDYTAKVPYSIKMISITALVTQPDAIIKINGQTVASGSPSPSISLNSGTTTINTEVTAADGKTKNVYSIVVTRIPSANANLASVTLSPDVLISKITSTQFKATVNASTQSIKVKPVMEDVNATVTINGMNRDISYSPAIAINEGDNAVSIVVTAESGTLKTYVLTVTRPGTVPTLRTAALPATGVDMPGTMVEISISKAVSANGDGINDHLVITGIEQYSENTLQVMNSKGTLIKTIKSYNNVTNIFDGHGLNGTLQPGGTYFYMFEYKAGNELKRKTGYFILQY